MADRTVAVRLVLEAQGYMQGMSEASRKTRETGSEVEKLAQKREAFNVLGTAALGFGAAVGVAVGIAVSSFVEFDAQMSAVQAATHETAENMDLLRDAAIEAGARTVFSATEAAAAIEELSKAGIATSDILSGGLDGALDLAAAGNIAVADAAEIAASAMTQFGLKGGDVTHVADLLAAGAGKAQGGVQEMSQALNQSGLVAAQMGLSLDDTVGSLTMFASAGLLGSDAGTSFRNMLLRLANPTGEAAELMKQLGLDFYDTQGQFIGIEGVAGQLETRLQTLTQEERNAALASLFGQDAIRAASILYEGGAEKVQEWTDAVNDAGYAQDTAATRLDNLKGDWEAFTGALDSAFISMGEGANGPLRDIVQGLTGFVDNFNAMPDWAQQSSLAVGAVTGGLALLVGAYMTAIPKIAEFNTALDTMGTGAQRAGRFVQGLGKVAGVAAGLLALTAGANALAVAMGGAGDGALQLEATLKAMLEGSVDSPFESISSEVTDLSSGLNILLGSDVNSNMERFGSTLNGIFFGGALADQVGETREQFATMGEALARMVNQGEAERAAELFDQIATAAEEQGYKIKDVSDLMPSYQEALDGAENATTLAADSSDTMATAVEGIGESAEDVQQKVNDLAEAIRNFGSTELNVRDAHRQFEAAFDDLTASIEENGNVLDISTQEGRDNEAAIDSLVKSTLELAAAKLEQTGNEEDAAQVIRDGRDALTEQLEAFGITGEAAQEYIDKLGLIPEDVQTIVVADTAQATQALIDFTSKDWQTTVQVNYQQQMQDAYPWLQEGLIPTVATPSTSDRNRSGGTSFAAGGFSPGIYPYTPGGINKFAEEYAEAFISFNPARRDDSLEIWAETGRRLGAWQPAPDYVLAGGGAGGRAEQTVKVDQHFNLPPGFTANQVEQISGRGVQRALR